MLKIIDILRISMRQALRQRRRYFGVILAIMLGTAGFITIMTMGQNVKKNLNLDLDLLGGATRIKVFFEDPTSTQFISSPPQWFRPTSIDAVRSLPGVVDVSLAAFKGYATSAGSQKRRHHFSVMAVDERFWEVNSFLVEEGAFFDAESVKQHRKVCVLGSELAKRVLGHNNLVGGKFQIERELYEITGVLGGGAGIADRTNYVFLPLTTAQDRIPGLSLPNTIYIRCGTWDDVERVSAALPGQIRSVQPVERLRVDVAWEQLRRVQRVAWWVELFIYVSIAATLILGGFGMWNGMMSAVQMRTREIGLKKAIGAEDRHIMAQFLSEALFLSLGSGLAGVSLGRLAIELISYGLGSGPPRGLFSLSVAVSLLVSIFVGVGAGFVPSVRGSRMEVVTALRYE